MSSTRGGGEPCLALIVHPLQVFADLALKHRRIARRRRAIAMAVEDNVRGRALSFLDAAAVCTMSRVCKAWSSAAESDALWEFLLQRDWSISVAALRGPRHGKVPAKVVYRCVRSSFESLCGEIRVSARVNAFADAARLPRGLAEAILARMSGE